MSKALLIKNIKKTYANNTQALKGIDLSVEEGDFFALLGPNGAGKSTIIGIISTLINKTEGTVSIFGQDLDTHNIAVKRSLGVVPQEFNFNMFEAVEDIIITQAGYYGIEAKKARPLTHYYLKKLGLWDKRRATSKSLSGGMKRRLMMVRALVHKPRLLILDEPTAGVDIELRRGFWSFLREINEQGTTIILTTHYLEEAEQLCRNIAIIDEGKIVKHCTMRDLLKTLEKESFILDVNKPLQSTPVLKGYHTKLIDPHALEVEVDKNIGLNQLFIQLHEQNINIVSMRNKTNRLEELFINMTGNEE